MKSDDRYGVKEHCSWADKKNHGIKHFGINPLDLKYSNILFDIFHMICQVTRKLMNFIRDYINTQAFDVKESLN